MNATEHLKAMIFSGIWLGHQSKKGFYCQECNRDMPSIPYRFPLNMSDLVDQHGDSEFGDCCIGNAIKYLKEREMKFSITQRGFQRIEFLDRTNGKCSIQKSSLALIWLGLDEGVHVDGVCCARMELDIERVKALMPILQYFVEHGELPAKPDDLQ